MSFIRRASIARFELYAKTVLMRTPANLSPSLKTSELTSHITSVNEVSIHIVSFSFGIQRTQEERALKIFNFFSPFYCPLKWFIAFSWSLSASLKCNSSCSRVYLQMQSQKCEEGLCFPSSAHHVWHLTHGNLKFPEMPSFLSMLYARTYRDVVWEIRHHCALLFPYKRKGTIHTCTTEHSLAAKGHSRWGARGSLSVLAMITQRL